MARRPAFTGRSIPIRRRSGRRRCRRRRQELVPAGRRLRLRPSARERSQQSRQGERRHRGRRSPPSAQHQRLFIVPAAGAKLEGANRRSGECRCRHHQLGEAGGRIPDHRGQRLAALVVVISDVHALGLATAHGLIFTTAFYWDLNDATRAWSKRLLDRTGRMPGMALLWVADELAQNRSMPPGSALSPPKWEGRDQLPLTRRPILVAPRRFMRRHGNDEADGDELDMPELQVC